MLFSIDVVCSQFSMWILDTEYFKETEDEENSLVNKMISIRDALSISRQFF